jgi:hypothetical protein
MFFFRTLPSSEKIAADSEGLDGQDDKEKSFRFLFLFFVGGKKNDGGAISCCRQTIFQFSLAAS